MKPKRFNFFILVSLLVFTVVLLGCTENETGKNKKDKREHVENEVSQKSESVEEREEQKG